MADGYTYIDPTGVIVPDTGDVLADVEQEFKDALGSDLNTSQGPQKVLIDAETTARMSVLRNNGAVANQINPDLAGGVFLDALWRLTGGYRKEATYSAIAGVALAGVAGTLIPAGSRAKTPDENLFESVADVTLGAGGTATVDFIAVEAGVVAAPIGTLTQVVSAVLGWETVTNAAAAVVGQDRETDAAARRRRQQTLALQGVALPEAITSALYDTKGVQSLTFRENVADTAAVIDGIAMDAHSIYACVNGGTDADVATVLLAKKSLGCGYNGGTVVSVTDPASGQNYLVTFDRPANIAILVRVTLRSAGAVANPADAVIQAILDYANGELDGETGFGVGDYVSPFELAGAINEQQPTMFVQKVELTKASLVNFQVAEIPIALNEIATIAAGSITVILP